jgi:two-component system, LuxR family, sensor kinase FixL
MMSSRDTVGAYGIGLAALVTTGLIKLALSTIVDINFTALMFAPAILIAAGTGGLAPGIFITVLTLPILVLMTAGNLDRPSAADFLLFGFLGLGIAWLGGSFRDARQRAEHSSRLLQRRETYLQSILDSVSDATITTRSDGEIISFNAAAEKLFGYRAQDILSRNVRILLADSLTPGDDPFLVSNSENTHVHVRPAPQIAIGRRRDGTSFPMSIETTRTVSGDEVITTGFVRDVGEELQQASALETAQLEVARLARLNEMGEMTSALAHEINQPLAAVANYVQSSRRMLERFDPSTLPQLRNALSEASKQALRAGEIIRHLRDFVARGETCKELLDLDMLIRDGADLATVGTKGFSISLRLKLARAPAKVLADSIQIQQVVVNLIRNAVDAVRDQPKREIVILTRIADGLAFVEVSDTGSGIAPELAAMIFDPFVTSKPHGMGIGLSVSKRLIESHGGAIAARARPGGGTVVTFSLPLVDQEALASG